MKKQLIFIVSLLFSIVTLYAQTPSQFPIQPNSVWRINYEYVCMDDNYQHVNEDEEYKYTIDGDTNLNSNQYFKLYKTGILYLDNPFKIEHKYIGAIRDSADKFYFINADETSESLLYDFSLQQGDSVYFKEYGTKLPIDEVTILENGRKQYLFYIITVNCGSANTIIEGIGWLGGLLEGNPCSGHPGVRGSYLVCYSEGDEVIYSTDHTRCGQVVTCNSTISNIKQPNDFNCPTIYVSADSRLNLDFTGQFNESYTIDIYNNIGDLKYHQLVSLPASIDLSNFFNGCYYARLSSKNFIFTTSFLLYR